MSLPDQKNPPRPVPSRPVQFIMALIIHVKYVQCTMYALHNQPFTPIHHHWARPRGKSSIVYREMGAMFTTLFSLLPCLFLFYPFPHRGQFVRGIPNLAVHVTLCCRVNFLHGVEF